MVYKNNFAAFGEVFRPGQLGGSLSKGNAFDALRHGKNSLGVITSWRGDAQIQLITEPHDISAPA